jgi:tetratricopeptide (TPR) repeat protein
MNEWFDAEDHVERAHELFEAGRWGEAESELRKALARNPYQAEWHFNLGLTLEASGRFRDAADSFKRAFELGPGDAQTAVMVGLNALRSDDPEGALPWLDRATELERDRLDALIYRIEALTRLGRHEQAEETYYYAQQLAPENAEIYAAMAESLLARDLHEKAVWCLREAARLDPELPRVEARLAEAYARTGRLERARQLYLRELRRDPGGIDTLLDLGELLLDMHRQEEAAEKFRRVLELEPDNADAHFNLGRLASETGDRAGSLRQFDLVVRLDPTFPSARCRLAAELLGAGSGPQSAHWERARQLLLAVLREQSDRPDRFSVEEMDELGQLLLDASMPVEAGRVFRRIIARRPNNASAHHALSVCHFLRGDRAAGMESARAALRLEPRYVAPMHNLAMAYLEQGQWTRARYWAAQARRLAPDDPSLRRLRLKLRVQAFAEVVRWAARIGKKPRRA